MDLENKKTDQVLEDEVKPVDSLKDPFLIEQFKRKKKILLFFILFLVLTLIGVFLFLSQKKSKDLLISPINDEKITTTNPNPTNTPKITPNFQVKKEIIGFLPSWIVEKKAKVHLQNLDQLIYFGLGVNSRGELIQFTEDGSPTLEWLYFNSDYFDHLRKEASASGTKVLMAIKSFDNETIDNLISNQGATTHLINQLINLIEKYGLDGVNVNFEYVTDTEFPTSKYLNRFLESLKARLKEENPSLIISFDVNPIAVLEDKAYDLVKIGEVVDQVILMAYDYRRANSIYAGPGAPIKAEEGEYSIDTSLASLYGRVPFEKLILGVPFYGYEWQTINQNYKSPTVEGSGALATYKRVQELLNNRDDLVINWDEKAESSWLIYRQNWAIKQIYYEDEKSLSAKLKLVNSHKLAGIAIWALGYEGEDTKLWETINENF